MDNFTIKIPKDHTLGKAISAIVSRFDKIEKIPRKMAGFWSNSGP